MHIILHAGAHCTDEGKILSTLFKNRTSLSERGIAMPKPRNYRQLLLGTIKALSKRDAGPDSRQAFLDAILDDEHEAMDRIILNHDNFFGVPKIALNGGRLYSTAPSRVGHLAQLFAEDQVELFLAIRNPATFLPALFAATPHTDFLDFMDGADVRDIRWSDLIETIRAEAPNVPITVWCNEDTPLIWAELIREIAGLAANESFDGKFDLLAEIMSPDGMARFDNYIASHPDMTEIQTRRVIMAFLDKFALDDMVEEELDIPGLSEALIQRMTEQYEEDVYEISRIPGVTVLSP